jgi:hypothetical protein
MTITEEKIVTAAEAAAIRAARGAQWLDELLGTEWITRIDPETLYLGDAHECICGQVFGDMAVTGDFDERFGPRVNPGDTCGFTVASRNLFSEANSWVTALVKKEAVGRDEDNDCRAEAVAIALGFEIGATADYGGGSEREWEGDAEAHVHVTYRDLQNAWKDLLAERHVI